MLCLRVPMAVEAGYPIKLTPWTISKHLASNVLNIQNYVATIRPHTWSLAVEEHFYLLLPFLLYWLTRRRRGEGPIRSIPALPWIALGLTLYCIAGRWLAVQSRGGLSRTHLRIDALFVGVLLAYWARFHPGWLEGARRFRYPLLAVGSVLSCATLFMYEDRWYHLIPIGITAVYVGHAAIVSAVVATPVGEGWLGALLATRAARVVAYIGFYSYTIYLWHIDLANAPFVQLHHTEIWGRIPPMVRWFCGMPLYVALATFVGVVTSRIARAALAGSHRPGSSRGGPRRWNPARRPSPRPSGISTGPPWRRRPNRSPRP